ncbi:PfkB family carbohydrate kinase [Gleimia sp. 6138-11-ORH1]|uniref:PfkB family carbohydrate kinase n=1 Tax=Gleimia sp. 6138-11-ORH1 TaxID=2973937 RepID=UPI00216A1F91|nr:PfkB family carbohydrate kinase [Gleimia sp. 6138-11-ORH1]MCS4484228.1 PfkB family carbohydrate kinase [Gleimia sp. 6138-11-ORH1]
MGRFISTQPVVLNLPTLIDRLPKQGEMLQARSVLSYPGGGFIGMAAAAELGVDTAMLSVLGTGPNSYVARREILSRGIEILTSEMIGDIGMSFSLVEADGNTTVILAPGVEEEPIIDEYRQCELHSGDVVLVHGACLTNPNTAADYIRWVSEIPSDVVVVLAPSPIVNEVDEAYWVPLLGRADYLTMNSREHKLLREIISYVSHGKELSDFLKPEAYVIVRKGEEGCYYWRNDNPDEIVQIEAFHTVAVDTSGVGDTHVSVMCGVIAQDGSLDYALRAANAAGACMVAHAHSFPPPDQDDMLNKLLKI